MKLAARDKKVSKNRISKNEEKDEQRMRSHSNEAGTHPVSDRQRLYRVLTAVVVAAVGESNHWTDCTIDTILHRRCHWPNPMRTFPCNYPFACLPLQRRGKRRAEQSCQHREWGGRSEVSDPLQKSMFFFPPHKSIQKDKNSYFFARRI